jgi:hypothetical protein
VAVLVPRTGFQIMIDAFKVLLDATLDYGTLDEICNIMESHPDVTEVVCIGGRSSGRYKSVEMSLQMHTRLLREAHEIVSHLEEEILDRWPEIDKILIHYEPQKKDTWRIAVPVEVVEGSEPDENAKLSDQFGETPYPAVLSKNILYECAVKHVRTMKREQQDRRPLRSKHEEEPSSLLDRASVSVGTNEAPRGHSMLAPELQGCL